LVSGGGVGITLPLSAAHSTEDSDDAPPLGWLDEAGSPSPSVSRLPVPGSLELCRAPLCIDALPATSITLHASPKKDHTGKSVKYRWTAQPDLGTCRAGIAAMLGPLQKLTAPAHTPADRPERSSRTARLDRREGIPAESSAEPSAADIR